MKLVLFDFDGTIADSFEEVLKIFNELSKKYNLKKFKDDKSLQNYSTGQLIKMMNIPFFKIPFLLFETKRMMKSRLDRIKMFEGVTTTLKTLKEKDVRIGILSSNNGENIRTFLSKNDLNVFEFIYSGSGLFDKSRHMKKICRKHKINPGDMVYVGDEVRDIIAARKAGIKIISVTYGYNTKDVLQENNPDYLIDNIRDIIDIIDIISTK